MVKSIFAQLVTGPGGIQGLPKATADQGALSTVLSIVFAITAAVALLVIVIAGFRYIVARGDPNSVSQARNTILYAVIGLLISLAAFSIVTFVLKGIG
jgi:hypothetical protein